MTICYMLYVILHDHLLQKMQLDVNKSPPANIMTFRLGLTHVTFDLDPCDLWP